MAAGDPEVKKVRIEFDFNSDALKHIDPAKIDWPRLIKLVEKHIVREWIHRDRCYVFARDYEHYRSALLSGRIPASSKYVGSLRDLYGVRGGHSCWLTRWQDNPSYPYNIREIAASRGIKSPKGVA